MKIGIDITEVVGGYKITAQRSTHDREDISAGFIGEAYAAKSNQIAVRIKELIAPAFEKKS